MKLLKCFICDASLNFNSFILSCQNKKCKSKLNILLDNGKVSEYCFYYLNYKIYSSTKEQLTIVENKSCIKRYNLFFPIRICNLKQEFNILIDKLIK